MPDRLAARGQLAASTRRWITDASPREWLVRGAVAAGVGVGAFFVFFALAYAILDLPATAEPAQTTLVLDAKGNRIAQLFKDQNRIDVPLRQVAPEMRRAVVATEDRNFYSHGGIDPIGIGRALVNDLRGQSLQGGSTITQQLVKNTYLTSERSLTRKVKEAVLAIKVERQQSKDEILERYLNTVYFGRGAHGVEQASRSYFGIPASKLDLAQSAFLAGLVRAPERADPELHPEEATTRRAIVLQAMVRSGDATQADVDPWMTAPVEAVPRPNIDLDLTGGSAYFIAQVRQWAVDRFGERLAFGGGLQIHTTLRSPNQRAAEQAVAKTLDRPDDPDAALVSMASDGAVVAMVGGKGFEQSKVNLAVGPEGANLGRQPGSTFKPIVLAAALEAGIPVTQRYAGPAKMNVRFRGFPLYPVENFGGEAFGAIDLTTATSHSVNTVYAQLASQTGMQSVVDMAHQLGIESKLDPYPSLALGAKEVNPLEMVRAYMTLANRGERVDPYYVTKVERRGHTIYRAHPKKKRVMDEENADLVNHVLQRVITSGTGRGASFGHQAAGKTGTTSNNTDAWFVGYTPEIGTAVWMGFKEGNDRQMSNVRGRQVTGGSFPATIWRRYMEAAVGDTDTGRFTAPPAELLRVAPQPVPTVPGQATTTSSTSSTTTSTSSTTSTTQPTTTSSSSTTTTTEPPTTTTSTSTTTSTTQPTTTTTRKGGG